MTVELVLGRDYQQQFSNCNHQEVAIRGYRSVLDALNSGEASKVVSGLHISAGHLPGQVIKTDLNAHYQALTQAAAGIAKGEFDESSAGANLAGTQLRSARKLREVGTLPPVDQISSVYERAIGAGQRGAEFSRWMRVTTLAALREADKKEATTFLGGLLNQPAIKQEIEKQAPSPDREGLLLAAPVLLHPLLLKCYQMSFLYGSSTEKGLALLSIKEIPVKLRDNGTPDRARALLRDWSKTYSAAIDKVLQQNSGEINIKAPDNTVWNRMKLNDLARSLRG